MSRALPFLVAAAAALPFLPALSGGFLHWDDAANLLAHDAWRGLSPAHLRWMAGATVMGPWQPLTWLSWAVDFSVWGLSPYAFHATNLALHAATAAVLTLLLKALLDAGAPSASEKRRRLAAAGAALLWAVHPLRAEPVAWITERREVLCAFFYVLSAFLYIGGRRKACFAAFVAACLSKGSAITLPLSFILLDVYPLKKKPSLALLTEKVPFFAVSLFVGIIGLLAQGSDASLKDLSSASMPLRLSLAVRSLSFYLEKSFVPSGLSPFYPVPPGFGPFHASVLASSALLALLAGTAWRLRQRYPILLAAFVHHAVALAPLIGLVRFGEHLAADRYAHLSGFALAALAASALLKAPFAAVPLGVLLGALSASQARVWRSDLALWTAAEKAAPSRHARLNLAAALREAGRPDEAAARDAALVREAPELAEPRVNYAGWLAGKGRHAEALAALEHLPPAGPYAAKARFNRALALEGLGRAPEAETELRAALALDPDYAEARNNLGLSRLRAGDYAAAERELAEAARLKPAWTAPWFNRGLALARQGRLMPAAESFERAAALGDPAAKINAASVRAALRGRPTSAGR